MPINIISDFGLCINHYHMSQPGLVGNVGSNTVQPINFSRRLPAESSGNCVKVGITNSVVGRVCDTEWDAARESQRQRELEEARARAAQMEKTMKWWSDCTANWREKWSKVRNERNKAREESKQLRVNLDLVMKEGNLYKQERNELELQISQLKKEMERVHTLMMKHAGKFHNAIEIIDKEEFVGLNFVSDDISDGLKNVNSEDGLVTKALSNDLKDINIRDFTVNCNDKSSKKLDEILAEELLIHQLAREDFDENNLAQKISTLQNRLDDCQKLLQMEQNEKHILLKKNEKLNLVILEMKACQDELRTAKQDAVRESLTLQEQHHAEIRLLNNSLQEEIVSRENVDRKLCELRVELERLQSENASEWGKRERLETEKLVLERDNKKLRSELRENQDRSDRKARSTQGNDLDYRAIQQDVIDKNKEITEIKLTHSKLKKMLSETNTELGHAVRRAEQYEAEVKRLRQRVEELKKELSKSEDELDSTVNQVRQFQRANEELISQNEELEIQLQHLQIRNVPSSQIRVSANSNSGVQFRNKIAVEIPSECLPNINDLRQIFDEHKTRSRSNSEVHSSSKRSSHTERTILQQSNPFFDAKTSFIQENIFESKSRNIEFERVKQKFDNPSNSHFAPEQRVRSGRNVANNQQFINKVNIALPLKSHGMSCIHNQSSGKNPINEENCKLTEEELSFRNSGGGDVDVGKKNTTNEKILCEEKCYDNSDGGEFSRNSINLDGLRVSDDETP